MGIFLDLRGFLFQSVEFLFSPVNFFLCTEMFLFVLDFVQEKSDFSEDRSSLVLVFFFSSLISVLFMVICPVKEGTFGSRTSISCANLSIKVCFLQ